MFRTSLTLAWVLLACQQYGAAALPTWPASIDDLEDILLLNSGYRARAFATAVTPCSAGAGPGRNAAAEWLRTAFHDMATGNTFTGAGGLDGSIAFELASGENIGSAFATTLTTFEPFFSSRTSLADIIAAGVYTATRSCGGPSIPVRGGRVDATTDGPQGVPLPQNALGTFKNQFERIGYSATDMISFVACGHTLGGTHSVNFPDIVPAGSAPNDVAVFDTTQATFDNKIVTEYVAGTTKDPLVVSKTKKNSDLVVFASDNNATIRGLQDAQTFANTCKSMFQKMIEVVPGGTTLTDIIQPYEVKPYDVQLTLGDGASTLRLTGDIRVRTTQRSASGIAQVQLVYKDRTGAAVSTPIGTSFKGSASGFDESFAFFGFSADLPASTSISSFNVVVVVSGGGSQTYDNNGSGYKVDDTVIYQAPQSCLDASGKLTVVAAVRNGASSPNLNIVVKNPRPSPNPIPSLSTATAAMATQSAIGNYQLYSASYTFSGSQAQSALFGVTAGVSSDTQKRASSLPTACSPLGSSTPTSTPVSSAYSFQGCYSDAGVPRALPASSSADDTMTVEKCANFCSQYQLFGLEYGRECYCGNTLDTTSKIMALSDCSMSCSGNSTQTCGAASRLSLYKNAKYVAPVNPPIAGYGYIGCYSEGSASRALADTSTASNTMTVETCAAFCNGATYFGLEYASECYCGEKLQTGSTLQSAGDCSMRCAGNSTEWCGAGSRLNVYQKAAVSSSSSASSTPTPSISSTASNLTSAVSSSSITSTISTQTSTSVPAASSTVVNSTTVSPDVISSSSISSTVSSTSLSSSVALTSSSVNSSSGVLSTSSTISSTTVSSSSSSSTTTSSTPTATPPSLPGYNYTGCYTDLVENRTLSSKFVGTSDNTYASCANFCSGYAYFGAEYGSECYCGAKLASFATLKNDTECNMPCAGNSTQKCGAGNRLTVFKSLTVAAAPSNPAIAGYTYAGCQTDSVNARVLKDAYYFDNSLTVEKCSQYCAGSKYFGTQYGGECYCGAEFSNPTSTVADSDCSFLCSGDKTEFCGAGNRLSVWRKNGNSTVAAGRRGLKV